MERQTSQIPAEAVEAVARFMYGEAEYDALDANNQAKDGYRKRAKALLTLACEAVAEARAKTEAQAERTPTSSPKSGVQDVPYQEGGK